MDYWLRDQEGERNNYCFSKIQLAGQEYVPLNLFPPKYTEKKNIQSIQSNFRPPCPSGTKKLFVTKNTTSENVGKLLTDKAWMEQSPVKW